MKKDKIKICILELFLIIILFFALFASNIITRSILSIIIFIYMLIVKKSLKKRKINSIYKKQVNLIMTIFAGVYIAIFYLLGLYFDFTKSKILFSAWTLFKFIIPLTIIIVSSEIIRDVFLSQKLEINFNSKKFDISLILTYISMVLVDLLIYTGIYDLTNLDDFLKAVGFVLFASLSCNLLYNYISIRFGKSGLIIYRLITTLFVYIIPITPDVYLFFRTFLRMIYPYIMYMILEKTYSKTNFVVAYKDKKQEIIGNTLLLIIMALFIMLISCQFKYGILVIGSNSMTGEIDKGDAVIFEKYNNQTIKEGQVIIFDYNGIQTVHRVIDITQVNGENRYVTKGDANEKADERYTTDKKIYGVVKLKVKYIGYPTIFVRSLFSKK